MDAKPQRPWRPLRDHGDENAPAAQANRTLRHHRNKSSPALSTMGGGVGLKATTKRTAFGDLSNIAVNRPARDDSAIPNKVRNDANENAVPSLDKKTAALLRPAQRPLSSSLKTLLNSVTNNYSNANSKSVLPDNPQPSQAANTRKPVTKRSTVFKDPKAQSIIDTIDTQYPAPTTASLAPVHRDLNSQPCQQAAVPEPCPELYVSTYEQQYVQRGQPRYSGSAEVGIALHSDGPRTDDSNVEVYHITKKVDRADPSTKESDVFVPHAQKPERAYQDTLPPKSKESSDHQVYQTYEHILLQDVQYEKPQQEIAVKHALPPVSEPEEYWDGDEDEENYDEEGYVTARSYKSLGDNTTGGATMTLIPKVNMKVKKELAAAKELIESTRTEEEIEDEAWDMSMVAEYGDEIFEYMRELEIKMQPSAHYMDCQNEIQWSMRSVLMDWLVQVHHRFGLLPETLFLCANYIDRFLSCKVVSLGKLQLVGATAIFVAAKYEEINCPSVQEIVYMVDGGYTVDEILKAERFMLSMLQFELGWPGPMSFLRRISKADDYDLETRTLAKYFLEITIMDERFLGCPPSFTAAGAHCLSRLMLKKGTWSPAHAYYSNYTYTQLYSLVKLMFECCESPQKHHAAIYDKYQDKRYKRASNFVENEVRKGFRVMDAATNNAATFVNFYNPKTSWEQN